MRLSESSQNRFLLRSAIADYEQDRIVDSKSKLLELVDSEGATHPEVFEYLYLICKYEETERTDEAAKWQDLYVARVIELADAGDIGWKLKLVAMRQFGDRVPVDYAYVRETLLELANQNVAEAQYHLAVMHKHGHCGLSEDLDQYCRLLESAAAGGYSDAKYELALLILSTEDPDHVRAMRLMKESAKDGFKMSIAWLAENG